MRIGIDIRAIGRQRTGDEVYTLELVKGLLDLDKKNDYFLFTNTEDANDIKYIRQKIGHHGQKNWQIIPVLPASKLIWTMFALPRTVKKLDLDVVHVQYIAPLFGLGRTRLVTTIHDVSFKVFSKLIRKFDLLFLNVLIPLSIWRAKSVIGVSGFTKEEVEKYYPFSKGKVFSIHNGGASEAFLKKYSKEEKKAVRDKYGFDDHFIFYVGTLQPRKDVPTLIRAFALMKSKYSHDPEAGNISLVIGGKRGGYNYDNEIDEVLDELSDDVRSKIKLLGFVDQADLPIIYQQAALFCFPSLYEGYGIPIIEAMASEIPVVCAESSCLKEIGGDAAVFFSPKSPEDLAEKLFGVIIDKDLSKRQIELGVDRAKEFDWKKTAQKTLEIYENSLK